MAIVQLAVQTFRILIGHSSPACRHYAMSSAHQPVGIMQCRLHIEHLELCLIGGHRQYRSLVMMVIIIMDYMERCKPLAEKQQQQQNTDLGALNRNTV